MEREAKQIDEELKKMIKMSEKTEVNLDKIEEHSEKRKKLRRAIDEARSLSLEEESKKSTPYKQGKGKGYTVIIQNLRSSLKNKKELYDYLLKFGDICGFRSTDNSKIDKRINPRKNIMVSYTREGGLCRAHRGKHRDLEMYTPTMTEDEESYQEHPKQDDEYGQSSWELMGGRC